MARPHPAEHPAFRPAAGRLALAGGLCAALFGFAALPPAEASAASSHASPNASAAEASAASSHAVSTLTPSAADAAALAQAYAEGRHIPRSAVGAVRAGSAHLAEVAADGTDWAVASFQPSASAGSRLTVDFQDGAARGLFEKVPGGGWQLVPTPTVPACATSVPAAVKTALGLSASAVDCDASAARPSAAAKAAAADGQSLGSKISSIALGQVGLATTPAETSFNGVDCDPFSTLDAAFSPNADGCGPDATHQVENQNEEWCSDFAKWAWAQAGVTADMNTLNAGANSFYAWALQQGQTLVADSGTPQPGDAVLFYPPGAITTSSFADHVGVISSVNADGTVDIVDGDFLGSTGITVEYDQDIDLTSWASAVWNAGEQWMLIPPPTAGQQPVPSAAIIGPTTAAAGTAVDFAAVAAEPQGSITQYYWTFDDGRNNNVTAQDVAHVFQRAGLYTVTMSATSNFGTVTTKTWNIGVSAPSSTVSSVPNNSVWYTTEPVMQYAFAPGSGGSLAVDSWDGASWLQQTEPGQLAGGSPISGLTYSDADAGYATVPHAYYRTPAGTLGETYLGVNGWTSTAVPGAPAARSAISALAADPAAALTAALQVTPSLYFFDGSGSLNVSSETSGAWSTETLSTLPATADPGSLTTAVSGAPLANEYAFYLGAGGRLTAASDVAGHWVALPLPNGLGVQAGTPLAAATTNDGVEVFFVDAAGGLAVAGSTVPGLWQVRQLPGAVAEGSTLTATNTLSAAGAGEDEVYYLTAGGTPGVTASDGTAGQAETWQAETWQAGTLPGTADTIEGASPDIVPGQPEQLFYSDAGAFSVDTAAAPGAAWAASALPSTPTTYPGTVLLYAATPADDATALAAASYAGLPASQVTTDFDTAWGATLSGDYLVIAVGAAANNALYDNPCGWVNPSQDDPGSTPFGNVERPLNVTLTNLFLVAEAATASQTPQVADDMAYYAVHGALPGGVVALPALAYPGYGCLGAAS